MIVNNITNINKKNNHLSLQIIEHKTKLLASPVERELFLLICI